MYSGFQPRPSDLASGPASGDWTVICDFDGTITPFDVTDGLLGEFASPEWEDVEREWLAGQITARQCMERQVSLMEASLDSLDTFLDSIPLTPGFAEFSGWCRAQGLVLLVVSDGLDYSIKRILSGHGLGWIPVVANRLLALPGGRYRLGFPYGAAGCPSGVCKCGIAAAEKGRILLVGDGLSDCCLGGRAQFIMAKEGKELHRQSMVHNYPHLAYSDFYDVRAALAGLRQAPGYPAGIAAPAFPS